MIQQPFPPPRGTDDRYASLKVFTASGGDRQFTFPLRIGKVENGGDVVRFDQFCIVDNYPNSTRQADPTIIRSSKCLRNNMINAL